MKTCEELRAGGVVAIVGAGPAGLALARLLEKRGVSAKVFERDISPASRHKAAVSIFAPVWANALSTRQVWKTLSGRCLEARQKNSS